MTKAELISEIARRTGLGKVATTTAILTIMDTIKSSMTKGENVYLRGFGSFVIKKRAKKIGRNIKKNTPIIIPAHNVPTFKPSKELSTTVKKSVK